MVRIREFCFTNILRMAFTGIAVAIFMPADATEAEEWKVFDAIPIESEALESEKWIREKDRVAWLGGRLWEQMQERCDLETQLAIRLAGKGVTFRNVAWSGDDIEGRARAVFGSLEDGYQRRLVDLKNASPTVVFVAYGQPEAVDPHWTVDRFEKGLSRLVGDLKMASYRIVLFTPTRIPERTEFPSARLGQVNARIEKFAEAVRRVGSSENCSVLELPPLTSEMTRDGLQPHSLGYTLLAHRWAEAIAPAPQVQVPVALKLQVASDSIQNDVTMPWSLSMEKSQGPNSWRWKESVRSLPAQNSNSWSLDGVFQPIHRQVAIEGLTKGRYRLSIEGKIVAEGDAQQWKDGIAVNGLGVDQQREAFQQSLIDQEAMFMHRYRPQNETYLFLFRKHEQGNNAGEIDRFAEMTESQEGRIQSLLQAKSYSWELHKVE